MKQQSSNVEIFVQLSIKFSFLLNRKPSDVIISYHSRQVHGSAITTSCERLARV